MAFFRKGVPAEIASVFDVQRRRRRIHAHVLGVFSRGAATVSVRTAYSSSLPPSMPRSRVAAGGGERRERSTKPCRRLSRWGPRGSPH
jgi:hypothetical protein